MANSSTTLGSLKTKRKLQDQETWRKKLLGFGSDPPVKERKRQYRRNFVLVYQEMSKFDLYQPVSDKETRRGDEEEATETIPQDCQDGEEEVGEEKTRQDRCGEPEVEDPDGEDEEKARYEWDFSLSSSVFPNPSMGGTSDAIGVIELDSSDSILATGGSARKIRIYRLDSLLNNQMGYSDSRIHDHASACEYYICTPAKLSSLRWRPDSGSRIMGSGDYDGVVTEYDLEKRIPVRERDEHGGKRVWSIDYRSGGFPPVGASGSDDGTVRLWDSRSDVGVAVIQPSSPASPVCSVEFDQQADTLMAVGSADRLVHVFDCRWTRHPAYVLRGHRKPVSYVRFVGPSRVVSAATDGSLKLWDLNGTCEHAVRTYRGHMNSRNFVGLSAWRAAGLLGCGSESNEVYVYDCRWKEPIWSQRFEPGDHGSEPFVSSVCWRQHTCGGECTLVAGGSNGVLQIFRGKRKEQIAT